MYKKLLLALLAGSLVSSSFALSLPGSFLKSSHHQAASANLMAANAKYTDFSGTWSGSCGDSDNLILTIRNSARSITISENGGSETFKIDGSLQTVNSNTADSTEITHSVTTWNDDSSVLNMKIVDIDKDKNFSDLSTSLGQMNFSLINKTQLNMDIEVSLFINNTSMGESVKIACTFNKIK